jgi:poly(A) polymerase
VSFKKYNKSDHLVEIEKFDHNAIYITEKLKLAGFEAYIVGGSIRDLLLGKTPKDFDISTSAKPEDIKKIFRNCLLIGRRFRLAHIRFGKKVYEVSTFRAGDPSDDKLILRDNEWGTIEEDALRRDFTINGLFYDPSDETILDYVGGIEDIKTHTIRSIGNSFARFKQDPVRMIRLIKFQARFGFNIDPESLVALAECRNEILKSSQARIFEEVMRMLESGSSAKFMKLLTEHGFLELLAPGLNQCFNSPLASDMYAYLETLDTKNQDRIVGTACMLLPILDRYLKTHYEDRSRHPHLGEIQEGAYQLIQEAFSPFFVIPKKFRAELAQILSGQFRLTPLETKKKMRAPHLETLGKSLELLELRSELDPALGPIVKKWKHRLETVQERKPRYENKKPPV